MIQNGRSNHEERTLNRCKTLAIAGLYSSAVKTLMRAEPNGVSDEDKIEILHKLLLSCNFLVDAEGYLNRDHTRRMDLIAEKGAERYYIDVTVFSSSCRTHAGKAFEKIVQEKQAEKEAKYRALADTAKYKLLVFAVDTYGRVCEEGRTLLTSLWQTLCKDNTVDRPEPLRLYEVLLPLSEAIAKGNAQCVWKAKMLPDLGIDFSKTAWGRPRAKPATRDEEESEAFETKRATKAGGHANAAENDDTNTNNTRRRCD